MFIYMSTVSSIDDCTEPTRPAGAAAATFLLHTRCRARAWAHDASHMPGVMAEEEYYLEDVGTQLTMHCGQTPEAPQSDKN